MVCSWVCEGKSIKTWEHSIPISPRHILLLIPVPQCATPCLELLPLTPLLTWRGGNCKPLIFLPWKRLMSLWSMTDRTQLAFLMPDWPGQMGEAMGTLGYIKLINNNKTYNSTLKRSKVRREQGPRGWARSRLEVFRQGQGLVQQPLWFVSGE